MGGCPESLVKACVPTADLPVDCRETLACDGGTPVTVCLRMHSWDCSCDERCDEGSWTVCFVDPTGGLHFLAVGDLEEPLLESGWTHERFFGEASTLSDADATQCAAVNPLDCL